MEKISGYPVVESSVLTGQGIIKIGEKLLTDSESRARLKVGAIGEIDIEPESEIEITGNKIIRIQDSSLSKGKISVRTWVAPKLFSIKTPSAVITDFGCMYYLSVDDKASTTIQC
ncbi:MAG: FecR domain-containing protein [Ignavibacteriales bacterium]|nr:FecR domain-containing protein [Ignavibacteriales bacterium]